MLDCCLLCSSVSSLSGELSSESKTGRGLSVHAAMTQCYFNEGVQLEPEREKKVEDMRLIANKFRSAVFMTPSSSLFLTEPAKCCVWSTGETACGSETGCEKGCVLSAHTISESVLYMLLCRSRTMSDQAEDVSLLTPQDVSEPQKEEDTHHAPQFRQVEANASLVFEELCIC